MVSKERNKEGLVDTEPDTAFDKEIDAYEGNVERPDPCDLSVSVFDKVVEVDILVSGNVGDEDGEDLRG